MISFAQSAEVQQYSRVEVMNLLGLRSRSTLTEYCNLLGMLPGTRYFTPEDLEKLQKLRTWCKRGGRKGEYRRYYVDEEVHLHD